ncbi:MAG: IS110 family transposase [Anaerolineales bacterium]
MATIKYFVGIDIASSTFTACVGGIPWQVVLKPQLFENTENGYQAFLDWLASHQVLAKASVVCMEATGVYSEGLAYFLFAKNYQVAVQSPLEVKRTFKPNGPKTDAVDSLQIAEYACRHIDKLSFWQPRNEILEQVKALLATREQFVSQNVAHKNALQAIQRKVVRTPFAEQVHSQMIEQFKKHILAIDHEIRRLIESDPTFKEMLLLLLSVPGVGLLLAAHMILLTQQSLQYKQLASYLGIAPHEHSSGTSVFKHATSRHFGPPAVRKLLYLASCSVRTHQPQFQSYFLRKTKEGKPAKVVLNNIANKLIKIICTVLLTKTAFIKNYHSVQPLALQNP